MRVIAGTARGVRLGRVPSGVRPVSDRAREGIFSSLSGALPGARVLDLFAGTGALGIEALSRGAERAVFVERSSAVVRAVRDNLERARLADRAEVVTDDAHAYLASAGRRGLRFDLVLADPPYAEPAKRVDDLLGSLARVLERGGTVALTRRSGSSTPVIPVHWLVAKRLTYGDTAVLVFREE
jgi:16S rRNA (guanine(966)-N(2))-methyltransferase RsmD